MLCLYYYARSARRIYFSLLIRLLISIQFDYLKQTPSHLKGDMTRLVQHLIGPAKNPTQKYRVLFRWIAENIAYDVVGLRAGAGVSTAQEALQTGVAVCGGYVDLLKKFCE